MHIGQNTVNCPSVHSKEMLASSQEKYLGDVITSDAKIDENVKMRHDKGLGISNQIISILKEISFGQYYFEIGMLLRTSMLLNGILYNTEVLHNLKQKHIDQLEECDKQFMRRLFDAEQGTPIESFYLECSVWPLRFVILGRKFMYYQTLLKKRESELVKNVFKAQRDFPSKDDWVSEVQGALKDCNIDYNDEQITKMSKTKFKCIVKEHIQLKVMAHLFALQNKHSKSENLLLLPVTQPYLTSDMSTSQKKMLFKLRSKMLKIKANFSSMHKNSMWCSLCKDKNTRETEEHLLNCPVLTNHPKLKDDIQSVKYQDVFNHIDKQKNAVTVFKNIMDIFEKLQDDPN